MPMGTTQSMSLSPAVNDLGLGDLLGQQVTGETEEQRKKRMLEIQQRQAMGGQTGGSLATMALFGGPGGIGR